MYQRHTYLSSTLKKGFTVVELLIVIVILVILSLVTVVLYDAIATRSYDASLNTDVSNAVDSIETYYAQNGDFPATLAEVNDGKGIATSAGNTLTYLRKPYGYCMYAQNPDANDMIRIRSLNEKIEQGNCDPEISVFVGSSTNGYADGQGTAAQFYTPEGLTIDSAGNLYVAEYNNHRIRKVTPDGTVTTIAGNGVNACVMGTGTAASIGRPHNLVVDSSGNIFVMGCSAGQLLKITPAGVVSVFAGGTTSYCNGTGTAAGFYWSRGLTITPDDTMYVGGTELQRVCKVTKTGVVSIVAGSSTASYLDANGGAARFNWPWGLVMDSTGNLIVADSRNDRVRKIAPNGDVTTLAGSGVSTMTDGNGTAAAFTDPRNMAIDQYDNVYIADAPRIRMVTPTGVVSSIRVGTSTSPWPDGQFPKALVFNKETGILYAATSYRILKIIL